MTTLKASSLANLIVDEIKENFCPEEIFDDEALAEWAKDNGFVKPAEDKDE